MLAHAVPLGCVDFPILPIAVQPKGQSLAAGLSS